MTLKPPIRTSDMALGKGQNRALAVVNTGGTTISTAFRSQVEKGSETLHNVAILAPGALDQVL